MEIYRKNITVLTKVQAQTLLTAQDDFINNPVIDKPAPHLDSHLMKIWNGGTHLDWEWNDENLKVYDRRIAKEAADASELTKLQIDNEYFKNKKIRPWRNRKLSAWIDLTLSQLKYIENGTMLTSAQITERSALYLELLAWPDLTDFDAYKTDDEIDALKPSAPSWVT